MTILNPSQFAIDEMFKEMHKIQADLNNEKFKDKNHREIKLQIDPDPSVPPAVFKPFPPNPLHFLAHPNTIRAVRKDLFVVSWEMHELAFPYDCEKCRHTLDLQFWHFCPFCEAPFPKGLFKV